MNFILKEFPELFADELYQVYKLRSMVFIVEQNCAYQDVDEKDLSAFHVLMMNDTQLVGYARILPPGLSYKEPSIGRVVIEKDSRGKGNGEMLMKYCIKKAFELFQDQDI